MQNSHTPQVQRRRRRRKETENETAYKAKTNKFAQDKFNEG